jgi:hypothetical protein
MPEIQQMIIAHNKRFAKLYSQHIKPKFHQLLHIPEDATRVGKLLSCLVTERKHRQTKAAGLLSLKL